MSLLGAAPDCTDSQPVGDVDISVSGLTDDDLYLFNEGSHARLYDHLGAHVEVHGGVCGTRFAVWAPNARYVSVTGDFNGWDRGRHPLAPRGSSGIWEGFIPGVGPGALYKLHIASTVAGYSVDKADPFGVSHEAPPRTASIVCAPVYDWTDASWIASRASRDFTREPMSIYEVHLGSWMRAPDDGDRWLTYRELAPKLASHVRALGFTHVELMPVMEHPFYGSWGYQVTGYYAPSRRYGAPEDFMFFMDYLHGEGIGVILDWVPSHFPTDEHGLGYFDGTHLYEHADPRQGFHPDWKSSIFNYGRREVQSFLISNALYWLDRFHADGLRVDGVASMLYLDYSRDEGEWVANEHGGRENLGAIDFLERLNEAVYGAFPGVQTIAEESTAWPGVSRPTYAGGLGFGMKWDMGWMHDTLRFFQRDPLYRHHHLNELTFRLVYAFNENFVLSLSHDEVVHGKGSLLSKMPGDRWQKFANLRLLYAYMFCQPGKKLLFMGQEFGQWREWDHDRSLDWHLCLGAEHEGMIAWLATLNDLYRTQPALHDQDFEPSGFEWINWSDTANTVLSFMRKDRTGEALVAVFSFTPTVHEAYRIGVPGGGTWEVVANSDDPRYGGSGVGERRLQAHAAPWHGRSHSVVTDLPPLGMILLRRLT